jgi:hypothetical protein
MRRAIKGPCTTIQRGSCSLLRAVTLDDHAFGKAVDFVADKGTDRSPVPIVYLEDLGDPLEQEEAPRRLPEPPVSASSEISFNMDDFGGAGAVRLLPPRRRHRYGYAHAGDGRRRPAQQPVDVERIVHGGMGGMRVELTRPPTLLNGPRAR